MAHPAALVESINRSHGTHYRLVGPMPGGESASSHAIRDDAGTEYLLKCGDSREFHAARTVEIATRLRAAGYPAPEYVASGDEGGLAYLMHKILPGKPLAALTLPCMERIIELNGLQGDAAQGLEDGWPARIVESIERGFELWCRHDSMSRYSGETAAMLEELQLTASTVRDGRFRTADAVHFDLNPANILENGGEISGVIDWNGCCAGDRGFDLATLGFYALEDDRFARPLLERAQTISGRRPLALYLSHLILRQLDWSIRHHAPAVIDRYLRIARIALRAVQDLRAR